MSAPHSSSRLRGLIAVISSMALTALVFGFTYPMFATRLATMGVPEFWIGLNAAAQSAGVFVVAWFAPRLVTRYGPVRVMVAMTGFKLLAVLACILFPAYWPWLLMRMVIGGAGSVLWIAGETWINEIADEKSRGRELAIYSIALGVGTVAGVKIVEVVGYQGSWPFVALMIAIGISVIPILFAWRDEPKLDMAGHDVGLAGFVNSFRKAPLAIMLNTVFAAIFVSVQSFMTIYGLEVGMALDRSLDILIVFNVGGILLPYAAGWLADRMDRNLLSFFMVFLATLLFCIMGWALAQPVFDLVYIFVLGGLAASIYAVAMVLLGEKFRGAALASAAATFTLMWNVGGSVGPFIAGGAMEAFGPQGLPISLAILSSLVLPFALGAWLRRKRGQTSG
jgi:MFS family permease